MIVQNKQPKGMYVLGFAEVFERLSYYTLSFLLVLYASQSIDKGGLGWTKEQALSLAGFYTMAAYTLPLIGGFLADKFLGTYRAAIFGAFLIIMGHACIYFSSHEHTSTLFIALSLTATGTAFFKPSMPTLLGRLYAPNDFSREGGFKLYYMGINIGAMLAGFLGGLLLQSFGFRFALSSAGLGMITGLIVLLAGKKHLVTVDEHRVSSPSQKQYMEEINHYSPIYKKALNYLMLSFVFYAVWAVTYNIAISGTLSVYIEHYTNKTVLGYDIPTPFFQSLESIGIIIAAPILTYILHIAAKKQKPVHFFSQMTISLVIIFLGIAYFTHLTHVVDGGLPEGAKPFSWVGMSIFTLAVSVSEVLISPVMMSSISLLSPAKYRTLCQAFYLMVIGMMGIVASKIGAISLSHPYSAFFSLSAVTFVALLGFVVVRKKMVSVAVEASHEMHLATAKKIA